MTTGILRLAAPALLVSVLGGCGSPGGTGGETSGGPAGRKLSVLEAPLPKAHAATMEALKILGLAPRERENDGFRSTIEGEAAGGGGAPAGQVRVDLTRMAERTTKIEIRTDGRDGDRPERILEEIERRIGIR